MALAARAVAALLLLLPMAARPTAKVLPAFSWETLPVAWHSSNSTGRYSDAQIMELARYSMVTFEKFQNVRAVVPAGVLAAPSYTDPDGLYACQDEANVSRCGCCEEDEIVAAAQAIKAVNPKVVTVAYFNAQIAYPWYRASRALTSQPSWWSSVHAGPPGATWKTWDLVNAAAAAAWKRGCTDVTKTGAVDSCFIDGCLAAKGETPRAVAAKRRAIAELQEEVTGPLICGVGGGFQHALLQGSVGGVQDEGWGVINKHSGHASFATREIPGLMAAAEAGLVFQAHGRAVCGVAGKPCTNRTRPCWHAPALPDYREPAVQTELAAFLVAMGEYSYFVCGSWENYPANALTWNPVYDLPLGKPVSKAVLGEDRVWRREFESGTRVTFDTATNTGNVSWAMRPLM